MGGEKASMIDAFGNLNVEDSGSYDEETEYFSADENEVEFDDNGVSGPRDSIAISWGGFADDVRDDEELLKAFEEHERKLNAIRNKCNLELSLDSMEDTKDLSTSDSELAISGKNGSIIDSFGDENGDEYSIIGNPKVKRKEVRFTADTNAAAPATIACTICGHQFVPSVGSIMYTIQFLYGDKLWRLDKRYSEFCKFYKELKNEKLILYYELPQLPQKRWFEGQRWLNRFDYKFTLIRRLGLQTFLRDVCRIENIVERSAALRKFVGLKEVTQSSSMIVGELE